METPTPLPPLSIADLFTIIGEQQARIWQLTRALDAVRPSGNEHENTMVAPPPNRERP